MLILDTSWWTEFWMCVTVCVSSSVCVNAFGVFAATDSCAVLLLSVCFLAFCSLLCLWHELSNSSGYSHRKLLSVDRTVNVCLFSELFVWVLPLQRSKHGGLQMKGLFWPTLYQSFHELLLTCSSRSLSCVKGISHWDAENCAFPSNSCFQACCICCDVRWA